MSQSNNNMQFRSGTHAACSQTTHYSTSLRYSHAPLITCNFNTLQSTKHWTGLANSLPRIIQPVLNSWDITSKLRAIATFEITSITEFVCASFVYTLHSTRQSLIARKLPLSIEKLNADVNFMSF